MRLVTPGTLLEPQKPDANYLMSIAQGPDSSLGLGWLDLSTGEFHLGVSSLENLEEDLSRVSPAEVGVVLVVLFFSCHHATHGVCMSPLIAD